MPPHFRLETRLLRDGLWPVAGVDEAGRGPLAGPVAAAAVILDPRRLPEGVDDSKALTAEARAAAFERIAASALAIGVAFVSAEEIDAMNIRQATLAAMARAVAALSLAPRHALIDGNDPPSLACPAEAIVKGDASCLSIAAASIVAKVMRDRQMRRLAELYPAYGFAANAGYGTKEHLAAIAALGPTPHHRTSFSPMRRK
ncbi:MULTISPECIES: ribonuclease HII [Methylosinus]|uniref:Ribonuclease HII n=1 Tax=Methylosinus trichosporium (strain ATCC 35070 / NCIMB 11131 / UNIQEM 75 / OB3b) TaxID=595536 RepID=A0A2D2CZ60_METT3|nr:MULTISPECIES: ribonuclease HII [Methylosinus]ATQ68033.1 ribonuclease HII [Methylosinus trichosporium OB3b]OBS53692.1 ribonuclease HII [Methylosinus sp. 3S-1]